MYNLLYILWPMFYLINYLYFSVPNKINLNYLSFTHSVVTTGLSYSFLCNDLDSIGLKNTLYYFSTSYFIWDTLQILLRQRIITDWAYLYHHGICLFMLNQLYYDINTDIITNLLYLGELSNFFNYIVYHMIKSNFNRTSVYFIRIIQIFWFLYFRIYLLTGITYEYFPMFESRILSYLLTSIYFMGYLWGWGQIKSIVNDIRHMIKNE